MDNWEQHFINNYDTYFKQAMFFSKKKKELAEDIVQNVFLKLKKKKYNILNTNLIPYIKQSIYREFLNTQRSSFYSRWEDLSEVLMEDILTSNNDTEKEYSRLEIRDKILKSLDKIPLGSRKIMQRVLNGESLPEIAKATNKSYESVKALHRRGCIQIRKFLT